MSRANTRKRCCARRLFAASSGASSTASTKHLGPCSPSGFGSSAGQLYGEFQDRNAVCIRNSCSVVVLAVSRCVHCGARRYPGHLAAGSAPKPVINTCGNCCLCHAPPCLAVFGMKAGEVAHQVAGTGKCSAWATFCYGAQPSALGLREAGQLLAAGGAVLGAAGAAGSLSVVREVCWAMPFIAASVRVLVSGEMPPPKPLRSGTAEELL